MIQDDKDAVEGVVVAITRIVTTEIEIDQDDPLAGGQDRHRDVDQEVVPDHLDITDARLLDRQDEEVPHRVPPARGLDREVHVID